MSSTKTPAELRATAVCSPARVLGPRPASPAPGDFRPDTSSPAQPSGAVYASANRGAWQRAGRAGLWRSRMGVSGGPWRAVRRADPESGAGSPAQGGGPAMGQVCGAGGLGQELGGHRAGFRPSPRHLGLSFCLNPRQWDRRCLRGHSGGDSPLCILQQPELKRFGARWPRDLTTRNCTPGLGCHRPCHLQVTF